MWRRGEGSKSDEISIPISESETQSSIYTCRQENWKVSAATFSARNSSTTVRCVRPVEWCCHIRPVCMQLAMHFRTYKPRATLSGVCETRPLWSDFKNGPLFSWTVPLTDHHSFLTHVSYRFLVLSFVILYRCRRQKSTWWASALLQQCCSCRGGWSSFHKWSDHQQSHRREILVD